MFSYVTEVFKQYSEISTVKIQIMRNTLLHFWEEYCNDVQRNLKLP